MRGSKPGERRGGRAKGTPNKSTKALKDAILLAAEEVGGEQGLVGYLKILAVQEPSAFASLLGKVLPLQVTGADGGPIAHSVVSDAERFTSAVIGLAARDGAGEVAEPTQH